MSQLYPRTRGQEGSSGVTKRLIVIDSLVGNLTGSSKAWVMVEFDVPSIGFNSRGGLGNRGNLWCRAKEVSTKQCIEPESMRAEITELEMREDERGI